MQRGIAGDPEKMIKENLLNLMDLLQNFICFIYISVGERLLYFWGTTAFRIKTFIFGIKLKGKIRCWGAVQIIRSPGSEIQIGDNVFLVSSSWRCTAGTIYAPVKLRTFSPSSKISIGNNVGLNGTSITARSKTVLIGDGAMIAPNVTIMDSDFHRLWPPEDRRLYPALNEDEDVIIGTNVWIGTQCLILKGSKIGNNSIIASGSVVTGNVPQDVLAGGVPAKVIKNLP
jgi:acetyltransferase-like isoleucine patch superfamily enzyme